MKPEQPSLRELIHKRREIVDALERLESELVSNPGPATEVFLLPPIRQRRRQLAELDRLIATRRNAW
jgi:hypothetical protein